MALNLGAESKLSQCVDSFINEVEDDFKAPQQSSFQNYMQKVKRDIQEMEEGLSNDKSCVRKLSASLKTVLTTGEAHGSALTVFADELVKFGTMTSASDPEIGNAFVKFGTLFNQMSSLLKNLISSSRSVVYYSLNLLFENELKGGKYKSNVNSLFNQYEAARNQTEKEEKKVMQQQGMNVQDKVFTAEELADKLTTDRRKFQLGTCDYMLKVIDVRMKRGVDLADHLVGYYQGAQESYFSDGSKLLSALRQWETRLSTQISEIRSKQEKEKKRLIAVKDKLKGDLGMGMKNSGFTQVDPSASTETTQKSGYLAKRPENLSILYRRAWPKRYCTVSPNGFTMAHSHTHAPHVRIPVMLFQFKECGELDGKKFCFRLQAQTRTYTFDAESDDELNAWRQVMTNCQLKLFEGDNIATSNKSRSQEVTSPTSTSDSRQLVKKIIQTIQRLPGNDRCCDCGNADPEWLSVNLGVLMCIHCSGRHRELGVQYSRIRSLKLDALKTSELLIARVMGNALLNDVLEASVPNEEKITPDVDIEKRREFITNKYINKKFIEHQMGDEAINLLGALCEAVEMRDIRYLLQVYAEGANLKGQLFEDGRTCLHLAIEQEDLTSLHIIDFILANSGRGGENCTDHLGNTPLHISALLDQPLCIKLLLNHNADLSLKNKEGKTALQIAEEKKFDDCIELLQGNKQSKCEHIDIDWGVGGDQDDDIYQSPMEVGGMRRSETADNFLSSGGNNNNGFGGISGPPMSASPRITRHFLTSSPYMEPRRRPISQFVSNETNRPSNSPDIGLQKSPQKKMSSGQLNPYPPPTDPAPPPPLRTVSKQVDPISSPTSVPVVPKRKKRESTIPSKYNQDKDKRSLSPPHIMIVKALYQCMPDRADELGFDQDDRIAVTDKLNDDWWRGYVVGKRDKLGVFPVNHIERINEDGSSEDKR